ncbi:MAG: SAM-dependent methyltransferase [Actinomycetes bacterium]
MPPEVTVPPEAAGQPDALTWLLSPAGSVALSRIHPLTGDLALDATGDPLALVTALRAEGYDEQQAAALATQRRLREQARPRMGERVDRWLFTPEGAQQVTRPEVARHRADRYRAAAPDEVIDLGCGLGSDLDALSTVADAVGVEQDRATALMAAHNVPAALVVTETAESYVARTRPGRTTAVFADPGRRRGGRRVLDPDRWSPPLPWVMGLPFDDLGIKVAPGIDHALVPEGWETEVVSADGDVVEAALYRGGLRTTGARRRATLLRRAQRDDPDGPILTHTLTDGDLPAGDPAVVPVGPVGAFLYEPDGAVIRAGLVAAVVVQVAGRLLDPTIAYVTADTLVACPFATAYRVEDVLPFSLKRLRAAVRALDARSVTIKKRGSAVDPEQLRRQLRLRREGTREVVVVLTRRVGRPIAVVGSRIDPP